MAPPFLRRTAVGRPEQACGQPKAMHGNGGRAASPAISARASPRRWPGRGGSAVRCWQTRRFAGTGTGPRPVHEFGGEAAGVRSRARRGGAVAGPGAAPRRVERLRRVAGLPLTVHPGGRAARGVAPRQRLLQLCRPVQRPALRFPLSAGDRPRGAVRARRRYRAVKLAASVAVPTTGCATLRAMPPDASVPNENPGAP